MQAKLIRVTLVENSFHHKIGQSGAESLTAQKLFGLD
jgi:hypothetical protein